MSVDVMKREAQGEKRYTVSFFEVAQLKMLHDQYFVFFFNSHAQHNGIKD